jgi:hypothetical protein
VAVCAGVVFGRGGDFAGVLVFVLSLEQFVGVVRVVAGGALDSGCFRNGKDQSGKLLDGCDVFIELSALVVVALRALGRIVEVFSRAVAL